ncbi:MAG TPA: AMIN domain-containing protein, partial [Rhodospirillales bacterium]|nr:AMIN domain-containing protein [Rhodospirillales bacterium]
MTAFLHDFVNRHQSRCFIALMAFVTVMVAFSVRVPAAEAVVTDVRVGEHSGSTRLVFDFDRKISFKIFVLKNPDRVVIDLPEVGWRLPTKPLPVNVGILQKLRYGLFKPGVSRVVLDVNTAPTVRRSFLLDPGATESYRLVID